MAYNSNKGKQHSGDIQYESDPDETQIDFDNDFIALKTNGVQRFAISGSKIEITGALLRDAGNAFDIGSAALPWTTVYAGAISASAGLSASFAVKAQRFHGTASYVKFPIRTETTHYTASLGDYTILADTTSANVGVKLPAASSGAAKIYNVKKINASNTVYINTGGGTIDGDNTKSLTSLYDSMTFHSDGTNWHII